MEAFEEAHQCSDEQAGLHLPGEVMSSSRPRARPRRPCGHQEALPTEALQREAVEMRQMFQAICSPVRLQSPLEDLWNTRTLL